VCHAEGNFSRLFPRDLTPLHSVFLRLFANRRKIDFHASLKGRAHASLENSTHNLERVEGTSVTFKGTDETGVFDNPSSIGANPLYSVLLFVDR